MGQGIVTDSFGEARYMGALANTRGFGDTKYKYFGMTPEPEIRTRRLKGESVTWLGMSPKLIHTPRSNMVIVDGCACPLVLGNYGRLAYLTV